jgi:hypothetical protein
MGCGTGWPQAPPDIRVTSAPRALADTMTLLRLASLVIAGLMIASAWSARSSSADDQDACRIGAVSPEEYQAIAAEVASMPAVDWQEIHDDPLGVSEDLEDFVAAAIRDRVQAAIASRESSDEQVAAIHALMRAIGAESAWARLSSTYEHPGYRRVPAVVYHYRIDVNRLGVFRPTLRWGRIDLIFDTDESWQTIGDLRHVAFHFPAPFSPSISGLEKDVPVTGPCPRALTEAERPSPQRQPEEQ